MEVVSLKTDFTVRGILCLIAYCSANVHPVSMSQTIASTVELVMRDWPIGHKNMVSQDRWSLVAGSVGLKPMRS